MGTWVYDGEREATQTVAPAMKAAVQGSGEVNFVAGLDYSRDTSKDGFAAAIAAAEQADVIVYVGGEEAILSGEGHSRSEIGLPGAQTDLLKKLAKTGKPIVFVLMAGRPIDIVDERDMVDSFLMAWHPGTMGGPALAELLFGDVSPSGRLPLTWPYNAGQAPIYYNMPSGGRPSTDDNYSRMADMPLTYTFQHAPGNAANHFDIGHKPLYRFGYGLSYSNVDYSDVTLSSETLSASGSINASVTVTNFGTRNVTETVQLYIHDVVAKVVQGDQRLIDFKRVKLAASESQTVIFEIKPDQLKYYDEAREGYVTDAGEFHLWIAPHAEPTDPVSFVLNNDD